MIVVTGATGVLGHAIVQEVVERIPVDQIGVSVRDPKKAVDLDALGVRVRQGDFDHPDGLAHAFEGATQVLIVSSNARASGGDPLVQHQSAISAARTAGVERIIYTSHMAASDSSAFPPMRDHYATEQMLRQSGLAWTALRNGFYASSAIFLMADAFKTGTIEAPADGKVAWTAHADLAEVAAITLADEGRFNGPTPPLTGSEELDLADLAQIASSLLGRPVSRVTVTDEDMRSQLAGRGLPGRAADTMLGLYIASRNGEFAPANPTLTRLLGHHPISMRDLIAEKAGIQAA